MMGEWIVIAYFLKCPVYVMRKWCLSVGPAWLGEGMLQLGTPESWDKGCGSSPSLTGRMTEGWRTESSLPGPAVWNLGSRSTVPTPRPSPRRVSRPEMPLGPGCIRYHRLL